MHVLTLKKDEMINKGESIKKKYNYNIKNLINSLNILDLYNPFKNNDNNNSDNLDNLFYLKGQKEGLKKLQTIESLSKKPIHNYIDLEKQKKNLKIKVKPLKPYLNFSFTEYVRNEEKMCLTTANLKKKIVNKLPLGWTPYRQYTKLNDRINDHLIENGVGYVNIVYPIIQYKNNRQGIHFRLNDIYFYSNCNNRTDEKILPRLLTIRSNSRWFNESYGVLGGWGELFQTNLYYYKDIVLIVLLLLCGGFSLYNLLLTPEHIQVEQDEADILRIMSIISVINPNVIPQILKNKEIDYRLKLDIKRKLSEERMISWSTSLQQRSAFDERVPIYDMLDNLEELNINDLRAGINVIIPKEKRMEYILEKYSDMFEPLLSEVYSLDYEDFRSVLINILRFEQKKKVKSWTSAASSTEYTEYVQKHNVKENEIISDDNDYKENIREFNKLKKNKKLKEQQIKRDFNELIRYELNDLNTVNINKNGHELQDYMDTASYLDLKYGLSKNVINFQLAMKNGNWKLWLNLSDDIKKVPSLTKTTWYYDYDIVGLFICFICLFPIILIYGDATFIYKPTDVVLDFLMNHLWEYMKYQLRHFFGFILNNYLNWKLESYPYGKIPIIKSEELTKYQIYNIYVENYKNGKWKDTIIDILNERFYVNIKKEDIKYTPGWFTIKVVIFSIYNTIMDFIFNKLEIILTGKIRNIIDYIFVDYLIWSLDQFVFYLSIVYDFIYSLVANFVYYFIYEIPWDKLKMLLRFWKVNWRPIIEPYWAEWLKIYDYLIFNGEKKIHEGYNYIKDWILWVLHSYKQLVLWIINWIQKH